MLPETKPAAPNLKLFIATVTIGILILAGLFFEVHLIGRDAAGTALWNSKEAYFIISTETRGYRVKWLAYPLIRLASRIGYFQPTSDLRGDLHVVHVTTFGVETHVVNLPDRSPGSGPNNYTPIDGRIWAHYPAIGGLCWWAGDHFEPATQEERLRIDPFRDLRRYTYEDRNGWSFRQVVGADIRISLDPNIELLAFGGLEPNAGPLSIQMSTGFREPVRIFSADRGGGRVNRSEYRRTFQNSTEPNPR